MLTPLAVLKQYGRRFAVGNIMAKALAHHLQLSDEGVTLASQDDVTMPAKSSKVRQFSRHDFFPCVYNDPYVVTAD